MISIDALAFNQIDNLAALIIAVRVEGMKAENRVREHRQEYPAYDEISFAFAADDMQKLVDAMRGRVEAEMKKREVVE